MSRRRWLPICRILAVIILNAVCYVILPLPSDEDLEQIRKNYKEFFSRGFRKSTQNTDGFIDLHEKLIEMRWSPTVRILFWAALILMMLVATFFGSAMTMFNLVYIMAIMPNPVLLHYLYFYVVYLCCIVSVNTRGRYNQA